MAKKHKREEAELDPEAKNSTQNIRKKKKSKKDKLGETIVDNVPTVVEEEDEADKFFENGSNDVGKLIGQQSDPSKKNYDRNTMSKKNKREEAETLTQKRRKKKKLKKDKGGQTVVDNVPTVAEEEVAEQVLESGSNDVGKVDEAQQCDPGEKKHDRNSIVVRGMPYTTQEEIREMLKDCGSISRVQLPIFKDTGKLKGLAFVRFMTQDAAKTALALDGMKLGDKFLKIESYRNYQKKEKKLYKDPPAKANGCLSAYVGNLSRDIKEDEIRELLKDCKIKSIKLALDRKKINCRGFGHVFFDDDDSLENAMKKNRQELHGRSIKIAYSVNY